MFTCFWCRTNSCSCCGMILCNRSLSIGECVKCTSELYFSSKEKIINSCEVCRSATLLKKSRRSMSDSGRIKVIVSMT